MEFILKTTTAAVIIMIILIIVMIMIIIIIIIIIIKTMQMLSNFITGQKKRDIMYIHFAPLISLRNHRIEYKEQNIHI